MSLVYKSGENLYFPYPDDSVKFAFQLNPNFNVDDEYRANIDELARGMAKSDFDSFINNDKINLIIYPISPFTDRLFSWFANAHALEKEDKHLKRIHPGSPAMMWKHLWHSTKDGKDGYQLVDHPLVYKKIGRGKQLFPLRDELNTWLVGEKYLARKEEQKEEEKEENDNDFYCGDVEAEWEREYHQEKVGDFKKCYNQYLKQTDLGNRLFGPDFGKPSFVNDIISTKIFDDEDDDVEINSGDDEILRHFNRDQEFENDALQWRKEDLNKRNESILKKYQDKQKELYKTSMLLPFEKN
jgi:hypothetical protein